MKSNKKDTLDAAAIAEAVTGPTMRFVEVKTAAQVEIQALHRIRDQMVRSRTKLICQMRAFCLEQGVAIRQGAGVFKLDSSRCKAGAHRLGNPDKARRIVRAQGTSDSVD